MLPLLLCVLVLGRAVGVVAGEEEQKQERFLGLLVLGYSLRAAAKAVKLSRQTARTWARRRGVKARHGTGEPALKDILRVNLRRNEGGKRRINYTRLR
eukprot:gene1638-534_t